MTAYSTGTATDHADLYAKLKTFLTTNSTLTAASENWTQVWSSGNDVVLRGPGLSSSDQIYIGLSLDTALPALWLRGLTGTLVTATDISGHQNPSPAVAMYLDTAPMTYWFVVNGRRFMVVVKISTVFEACYAGFFLPYAPPTTYGYPMFVGASRGNVQTDVQTWRSQSPGHTHFVSPYTSFYGYGVNNESSAWMIDPTGQWLRCWNNGDNPGNPKVLIGPEQFGDGLGVTRTTDGNAAWGYDSIRSRVGPCFDGSYTMTPISLTQQNPADQSYGVLDGCYRVAGNGNSSENIITASGVNHLVVQNVYRTTVDAYWAMALG
ncbi:MAG: hypothetical protein AAFY03_00075 [Pseudomonadota bacterium]